MDSEAVFEEEEVLHREDRDRFPLAEEDMVLKEDLEATLSYAIIAINRDTWLGIVSSGKASLESLQRWARMYNNSVAVEEEEEVVEEVELPEPRLLDLITSLNLKLGCMR